MALPGHIYPKSATPLSCYKLWQVRELSQKTRGDRPLEVPVDSADIPHSLNFSAAVQMFSFDDSEIYRSILESLTIGLCLIDMQKNIVLWSDGAERITGHLRHEVVGHSCIGEPLLHCDQPGCEFCSEECPIAIAMKTARPALATGFLHHRAGHEVPVRIRAVPVHNQHGSIIGAVETFENLQQACNPDRGEIRRQLSDCTDAVTGVASHAMMQSHLRQAHASFIEVQIPFGLLFFRVEELPRFRASLGPEPASSLLRVVARTLESAVWITDFVGRWADDQFVVILNGCREESLSVVRERVRRTLASEGIEWWGERRSLPVSIGEAIIQPDETLESLIERAQKSLEATSAWRAQSSTRAANPLGS
jgi:diguanylate cyclase (GGDEF)-like protein/PAS domain S-box-containing protein